MWSMIVAHTKDNGIGYKGELPWPRLSEDLKRFYRLTKGHVVIMGRRTFESLGKPLPDRINVVMSKTLNQKDYPEIKVCLDEDEVIHYIESLGDVQVFVCGGREVYKTFEHLCRCIYTTVVWTPYKTDVHYKPPQRYYNISSETIEENGVAYQFVDYCDESYRLEFYNRVLHPNVGEMRYLSLLHRIISQGETRENRTGTNTLSVFGGSLTFDLARGFPLLTTKRVFFRGVCEELVWFLSGKCITADQLQQRGVKIWDGNSTREYLDSVGLTHYRQGELGPIYGFQWRHFGAEYKGPDHDYTGEGFDQIQSVIDTIRKEPSSRRILFHGWNPTQLSQMALPPCHLLYMFYLDVSLSRLNCQMVMRSTDAFLGLPFNIASTALLVHIICALTGKRPGNIIISFNDLHLYQNHLEQARIQINRRPYKFPEIEMKQLSSLDELTPEHITLVNYQSHDPIRADMAV